MLIGASDYSLGLTVFCLFAPSYYGRVPVFALSGTRPTIESLLEAINTIKVDWSFVPPLVIDEIGKQPELLERLSGRSDYLIHTGGAVTKATGDAVANRVPIWQLLGSSEFASFPLIHSVDSFDNTKDWQHMQPNPLLGLKIQHQYKDPHKLVVERSPKTESILAVFSHFQDAHKFRTKDLFKVH